MKHVQVIKLTLHCQNKKCYQHIVSAYKYDMLAVHRSLPQHKPEWQITHIPTSQIICDGYKTRQIAQRVAERLNELPVDWELTNKRYYSKHKIKQEILKIIEEEQE